MSEANENHAKDYHELSGADARTKIADLVKGIRICMMTTLAEDGSLDARPMAVQDKPFDGTLWFLTRATSEKVNEVRKDQHITLTFSEPSDGKYITLKGTAHASEDRAKIHELWNNLYKAWFPKGEDDPDIAVMRVDVGSGDYWDSNSSRVVRYAKIAYAAATGGSVPTGETGHVTV